MRDRRPASSHTSGGGVGVGLSQRHTWNLFKRWTEKAWDFLIYMGRRKKSQIRRLKKKKRWNWASFPASPFFCCHIGWGTRRLFPKGPAKNSPICSSSGTRLAEGGTRGTNIRDFFLPEWRETQRSITIFIFSHSFYFPLVCILYAWLELCLVKLWLSFFFPLLPAFWDRTYDKAPVLNDPCHEFRNGSMFAFPYFSVVFFSNHKITLYTCIVWLYWNYVEPR